MKVSADGMGNLRELQRVVKTTLDALDGLGPYMSDPNWKTLEGQVDGKLLVTAIQLALNAHGLQITALLLGAVYRNCETILEEVEIKLTEAATQMASDARTNERKD